MSGTGIPEYSTAELMVVEMARHLVDGDRGGVGTASALPLAAARLAQVTHAPNLSFFAGASGAINPHFDHLPATAMDTRAYLGAEGRHSMELNVDFETAARWDFGFFGVSLIFSRWKDCSYYGEHPFMGEYFNQPFSNYHLFRFHIDKSFWIMAE